MTQVKLDNIF